MWKKSDNLSQFVVASRSKSIQELHSRNNKLGRECELDESAWGVEENVKARAGGSLHGE